VLNFGKVIEGEVGNTKLKLHNEGALRTQMYDFMLCRIVKTEDGL